MNEIYFYYTLGTFALCFTLGDVAKRSVWWMNACALTLIGVLSTQHDIFPIAPAAHDPLGAAIAITALLLLLVVIVTDQRIERRSRGST